MSGMHLMSHAYTTTNTRKRKAKNKSKKLLAAEAEHEKFDYQSNKPKEQLSNKIAGHGTKKEGNTYSGERQLLGIATMHKSNMVPIFADKKEDAKDIASMRR